MSKLGKPITTASYDQAVAEYGKRHRKDDWPFLSRDPNTPATADEGEWLTYFAKHLNGYPRSFKLFRNGHIRYYNVPEAHPQDFDMSYKPA